MAIQKFTISTGQPSAHLYDEARFRLWQETYCGRIEDIKRLTSDPFVGRWSFTRIRDFGMCRFCGTPHAGQREAHQIPAAGDEKLSIGFNLAQTAHRFSQLGREHTVPDTQPLFYRADEAYQYVGASDYVVMAFPKRMLGAFGSRAEALLGRPLDGDLPALRHLRRYLSLLDEPDLATADQALADHMLDTVEDLIVLSLGASGDAADMARMRGLRAARYAEIGGLIARGFADPGFSVQRVAVTTGLSPSYIQKLLSEGGHSFTERVLELRLKKARDMLADPRNDALKVSEIALACGFSDISYFNRCFRRRFGATPNECRGG
ncbi:AraC family transcriptional regulator [Bradyrhizobium manausense]|uniref:helix-turn-helix transcriptional regulator n=1 Tax=Bradyrhizobium manausense TaxID=989370 RepID=UPI0024BFFA36|nr:AraC family transcriptional regulator [Bradyrhizobium manausense]